MMSRRETSSAVTHYETEKIHIVNNTAGDLAMQQPVCGCICMFTCSRVWVFFSVFFLPFFGLVLWSLFYFFFVGGTARKDYNNDSFIDFPCMMTSETPAWTGVLRNVARRWQGLPVARLTVRFDKVAKRPKHMLHDRSCFSHKNLIIFYTARSFWRPGSSLLSYASAMVFLSPMCLDRGARHASTRYTYNISLRGTQENVHQREECFTFCLRLFVLY